MQNHPWDQIKEVRRETSQFIRFMEGQRPRKLKQKRIMTRFIYQVILRLHKLKI